MHTATIFIALDGMTRPKAMRLTRALTRSRHAHLIAGFKVHDLWDRYGARIFLDLKKSGATTIWLDVKLHDTPRTLLLRAKALREHGVDLLSVHAGSGVRGLRAVASSGVKVVAVTVLTSLDHKEVARVYVSTARQAVRRLVAIAKEAKVWGAVCSAEEVPYLSKTKGVKFVVPGIQLKKKLSTNQKRTGTPLETLRAGADYIVVGSAITDSRDPLATFERIAVELSSDS